MKGYLLLALTFVTFLSTSVKAEDTIIRTYIVAGQSNAEGFGLAYGDLLSGSLDPSQNLEDLGRSDLIDSQSSAYIYKGEFNNGIGEWKNLAPGYGIFNGVRFGPELSFSKQYKTDTGEDIAIVKYSPGNTQLSTDWNPNASETNHYDHFITTVNNAKSTATSVGLSLDIIGVLWMQGESDGFNAFNAMDYEANLSNFIAETRSDLSLPDLTFHIGQIADTPTWAARQQIWDAQEAVANGDSKAYLVNAKDLPLFIDDGTGGPADVHYTTQGNVLLGERFASSVANAGTPSPYPESAPDTITTEKNIPISVDVLENDSGNGLLLTSVNSWSAEGATIKIINGKADYTPKLGFIGEDSFWYVFSDYLGRTNSAKVTVDVTDTLTDIYPEGNPDAGITLGQVITIDVLANDIGSGLTITYSHPYSLRGGTVAIADNKLDYTPGPNFSGEDKIWYVLEDSQGRTNSGEVTIDAPFPVAITEDISVTTNTAEVIDALANDLGGSLSLSEVNAYSANGATVAIEDGKLVYTPKLDYVGPDSFWYVIKDYQDRTNAIEVTVTISD